MCVNIFCMIYAATEIETELCKYWRTQWTNKHVQFVIFQLPVLSAQLITAPTGKPSEIRNFPPAVPPRP